MDLTVGVVVPAYNAERYIGDALESVVRQTRIPDQIVVVDDGSTDATREIISAWAEECDRSLEIIRQENRGIPAARNAGIRRAGTDLVALLDADDIWEPFHLTKTAGALESHPELVLCFADVRPFDREGFTSDSWLRGKPVEDLPWKDGGDGVRILGGDVYSSLIGGNYIIPSTTVFRMEPARRLGLFDPEFLRCEDRDFVLRLSHAGPFAYYPQAHARRRVHGENLTHPRNAMSFARYGYQLTQKMLSGETTLDLTRSQRQATRSAARVHAEHLLYGASVRGVRTYLRNSMFLIQRGWVLPVLNPKHLIRTLAASLGLRADNYEEHRARS